MVDNSNLTNDELLKIFKEKHKHDKFEIITENELENAIFESDFIVTLSNKLEELQELIDGEDNIGGKCKEMFSSELIKNFINA